MRNGTCLSRPVTLGRRRYRVLSVSPGSVSQTASGAVESCPGGRRRGSYCIRNPGNRFLTLAAVPQMLFAGEHVPMVGICAIEPEQPVEIKAARAQISDGPKSRFGRFNLTRTQHEHLLEENGVYLFAIYRDAGEPELLGLLGVRAVIVEEELRPKWYSVDGREDDYQVAASRLPIDGLAGEADAE